MHKILIAKHLLLIVMTVHGHVSAQVYTMTAATALDAYSTQVWIAQGPGYHEIDPIATAVCDRRSVRCLDLGAAVTFAASAAWIIARPHSRAAEDAARALTMAHGSAATANFARMRRRP